MSAAVNSITGAQPGSAGSGMRGLDPITRYESRDPESQASSKEGPVFGSTADEGTTYRAGSIPPSLGNAAFSTFESGATAGLRTRALSDSRSKPCPS